MLDVRTVKKEVIIIRPEDNFSRVESEAGVIATLIHHPEYSFHSENLLPNHFSNKENRYIYLAICTLAKRGISVVDPYNIIEALSSSEATRRFANELSVEQLYSLIENSEYIERESIEEYKMLVKNVYDAAYRRDMYSRLKQCQTVCSDDSEEDVRQRIYMLIDDVMSEYSYADDIPAYKDVVDQLWDEIESRQGTGYAGYPFKFPTLNNYVTIEKGELITVGGGPKSGKSMLMLNCAVDLLKQDLSVLYIDSELSSRMFTGRLISHLTGIEHNRIKSGNYNKEEAETITEAKEWIKSKKFTHIYLPFFDTDNILTVVRKVNHTTPIDVLIIDYFKAPDELGAFETYSAMGRVSNLVKNEICGAMGIAGLSAVQTTATNKVADSARIIRNVSTLITLITKTPEEIEEDGIECGNRKAVVVANRNGEQHSPGEWIDLKFDGNRVMFTEAKQHELREPF